MAPTPARALAITASIVSRLTNGRAPSCTSTTPAPAGRAASLARTDCARLAPPATSARRSPTSVASHSGGRAATPAGTAMTTRATSGWNVNGRRARSSIGTPRMDRNCFGSSAGGPARTPAPAAATTTPTSGREPPRELTDPVHPHHLQPGRRDPGARGEKHAPEPLTRRLAEPPRAFHQRGHRGARDAGRASGEKRGGRIGHGHEPRPGHLEHADLVHRAEAILHRPEDPVVERGLTLEVEHRVHDMLERLRPGDPTAFGHVAHQQHGGTRFLGAPHQPGGALQQERGLPDPGLSAHEHDRPGDDSPAQDEIELSQAGLPPPGTNGRKVGKLDGGGIIRLSLPTFQPSDLPADRLFDQRIPRPAGLAATAPLRLLRAALGAAEHGARPALSHGRPRRALPAASNCRTACTPS